MLQTTWTPTIFIVTTTGKDTVKVGEFKDASEAYKLIEESIKTYNEKFNK